MKRVLKYSLIFVLVCFLVCLSTFVFLTLKNKHKIYENWQTKSNLLVIPENTQYDLLIMGGTQAQIFSRGINHKNIEKIFNKKILNIARYGGRGGIKQENAYLTYFYERKNKTQKILYFLTPWVLYTKKFNENNLKSFIDEPVSMHFLINLLKTGINNNIILNYLKANFSGVNPEIRKNEFEDRRKYNYSIDDEKAFLATKYSKPRDGKIFKKHAEDLISIIELAQKNNSQISIIVSTTLIKTAHQTEQFNSFLQELKTNYGVEYFDFSSAIKDENLYRDIDHLNSAGVEKFAQNHLKPVLDNQNFKQVKQ